MKQLILTLLLAMTSVFSFADNGQSTVAPEEIVDKQRFLTEMLSGNWVGSYQAETLYYHFSVNGKASIVGQQVNGPLRQYTASWGLTWQNDTWMLRLEETATQEVAFYAIDALTERQLLAHDQSGNELKLFADEGLFTTDRFDREELMAGNWATTYKGANGETSTVYLALLPDGTYTRSFNAFYVSVEEKGTWLVSNEGNFLFLRPDHSGRVAAIRVIRANNNTLVLKEAFEAPSYGLYFDSPMRQTEYVNNAATN